MQVTRCLQKSRFAQRLLLVLVLGATCMLIGDGCLTPSISVVAAISGLKQISSIGNSESSSTSDFHPLQPATLCIASSIGVIPCPVYIPCSIFSWHYCMLRRLTQSHTYNLLGCSIISHAYFDSACFRNGHGMHCK